MISNITNALPIILKKMRDHDENEVLNTKSFDLIETINFFNSILPKSKSMNCLKHMFIDCIFTLKKEYQDAIQNFVLSLDSFPFLKDFDYKIDVENREILIRSSYEELAIFSMIILGSIKDIKNDSSHTNKGIFISLVFNFLTYCIKNNYNVCKIEYLKMLENYNDGFDKKMFDNISFIPTSENDIGTFHFIGIQFNKDILCIFEKYKNVKFSFNEEDTSFIITMQASDWDDFWNNAPTYLKEEFLSSRKPS